MNIRKFHEEDPPKPDIEVELFVGLPEPTEPFTKWPERRIVSDVGVCTKCFSMWTVQDGCTNPKCPEIVYRKIDED